MSLLKGGVAAELGSRTAHRRKTKGVEREIGKVQENFLKKKREVWEGKYKGFEVRGGYLQRKALRISNDVQGGK